METLDHAPENGFHAKSLPGAWSSAFGGRASALNDPGRSYELIVVAPGPLVIERFGHVLLCSPIVRGGNNGTCVDFGSTSYDQPKTVLLRLLRDQARYGIQRVPMGQTLWEYRHTGRVVRRQPLELTDDQAQRLGQRLVEITSARSASYTYNIFRRNCATELRDTLVAAAGITEARLPAASRSYRQILESSLHEGWTDVPMLLAMDLSAGRNFDAQAAPRDQTFLPETLLDAFSKTDHRPTNATEKSPSARSAANAVELLTVGCIAFGFILAHTKRIPASVRLVSGALSTFLLGTLGLIVLAIATATPNLGWNENLLSLTPADYSLLIPHSKFRFFYASCRLAMIFAGLSLKIGGIFLQPITPLCLAAVLPLLLVSGAMSRIWSARASWGLAPALLALGGCGHRDSGASASPPRAKSTSTQAAQASTAAWGRQSRPLTLPAPEEQFLEPIKQSILGLAETGAKEINCQGIALNPSLVLFPKHCVAPTGNVAVFSTPRQEIELRHVRSHPTLDVSVASTAEPMPISLFPKIDNSCPAEQTDVSACIWGRSAHKLGLHRETLNLRCASDGQCLSESTQLPPGASGCPVFGDDSRTLHAMGFGWSRRGSHFVCVTEKLLETLTAQDGAKTP